MIVGIDVAKEKHHLPFRYGHREDAFKAIASVDNTIEGLGSC